MIITTADIAQMLDTDESVIRGLFSENDAFPSLNYRVLSGDELDECIKRIDHTIDHVNLRVSTKDGVEVWEKGWGEILDSVKQNGFSEAKLTPQYFNNNIFRLNGKYVIAESTEFENQLYNCVKRVLFRKYLSDLPRVVEFGSGTGASLLLLSEICKDLEITGCDWAMPAVKLADEIGQKLNRDIKGRLFNMFDLTGKDDIQIDSDTGVFTFHALEQLGGDFISFTDWLISKGPRIVFHLEPIKEFYDPNSPFDERALKYHKKRNYLDGFYTYLKSKETSGRVNIMEAKRLGFGGMYHEAYTLIVWKVK